MSQQVLIPPPPASQLPPATPEPPRRSPVLSARVLQTERRLRAWATLSRLGLILLITVALGLVHFAQRGLNVSRDKLGLTRVSPLENAPPILAFTTVALGGFRGLIANMLWIRANDLQEEDKYFEMVQLADWITKLQPHFVTVWVHQAWNMAYNISVKFTDPADRWIWVQRGIELLRDEGLRYNPNEPLIYRELAWFFQHKMGADLDDAHKYYKSAWVAQMNQVFGRGRPDFAQLIHPTTPEAVAADKLLRDKFKMNPVWMKEVDDQYGPLEWHLPESHAIYWAYLALHKTDPRKLKHEDLMQCRRVIFQSLQMAFRRGRLVYPRRNSDAFVYAPNLDIVPQTERSYREMMEQEPNMKDNIANGHKNFLKWAVYYLYLYGRKNQAEYWWKYLHEKYPKATPGVDDLEQYALDRAQETLGETSHDDAKAVLEGFIQDAFLYIAMGEEARGQSYLLLAQKFRARFQDAVGPKSVQRVGLPEIADLKREVLAKLLNPKDGLEPTMAAQLRTNLGQAADWVPDQPPAVPEAQAAASTNAPAASPPK